MAGIIHQALPYEQEAAPYTLASACATARRCFGMGSILTRRFAFPRLGAAAGVPPRSAKPPPLPRPVALPLAAPPPVALPLCRSAS